MIYLFLATGFEEIEALATLDILRRFGLNVKTVSVTGTRLIHGAHGIPIMADTLFRRTDIDEAECLILPGGMPGTKNLCASEALRRALVAHYNSGKLIAAICAAPMLLGQLELIKGKNVTCYPGFEESLGGANPTGKLVVEDGNIITGKGPGAAFEFGLAIAAHFVDEEALKEMRSGMILED